MRVFNVVTERDGDTTKAPGKTTTEIVREEFLYAAETIDRVWAEAQSMRDSLGHEIVSVAEIAPAIVVLSNAKYTEKPG